MGADAAIWFHVSHRVWAHEEGSRGDGYQLLRVLLKDNIVVKKQEIPAEKCSKGGFSNNVCNKAKMQQRSTEASIRQTEDGNG